MQNVQQNTSFLIEKNKTIKYFHKEPKFFLNPYIVVILFRLSCQTAIEVMFIVYFIIVLSGGKERPK